MVLLVLLSWEEQMSRRFYCVTEYEGYVSFAIIEGGTYTIVHYRAKDVIRNEKVYGVIAGIRPVQWSSRKANAHESVNVDGVQFKTSIIKALNRKIEP